jgi:hypothetical protein
MFRANLIITIVLATCWTAPSAIGGIWGINEDYTQTDPRNATNFEFILAGDVRSQITSGGQSSVTNAFANPTISTSLVGGNTMVTFSSSSGATIGPDPTAERHFGIFGDGSKPQVVSKGWSFPSSNTFRITSFFDVFTDLMFDNITIQIENPTPNPINVQGAGYQPEQNLVPLDDLNRNQMPPGSFILLPSLDGTYAADSSQSVVIPNTLHVNFVVINGAASFVTVPEGDTETGTSGEWFEVGNTPEPASAVLVGTALLALLSWRRLRFRWAVNWRANVKTIRYSKAPNAGEWAPLG